MLLRAAARLEAGGQAEARRGVRGGECAPPAGRCPLRPVPFIVCLYLWFFAKAMRSERTAGSVKAMRSERTAGLAKATRSERTAGFPADRFHLHAYVAASMQPVRSERRAARRTLAG